MFHTPTLRQRIKIETQYGPAEFCTFADLCDDKEHFALIFKNADAQDNPFVRIHSECMTGDLFGSARCDCGEQLRESLSLMQKSGGILIYLRQEGRGIGLYNKIDAYFLQDQGYDTFQANQKLNYPDDARNFQVAAEILQVLLVHNIHLITNNPLKVAHLQRNGILVEKIIPTGVYVKEQNRGYLLAKAKFANHNINLSNEENYDSTSLSY